MVCTLNLASLAAPPWASTALSMTARTSLASPDLPQSARTKSVPRAQDASASSFIVFPPKRGQRLIVGIEGSGLRGSPLLSSGAKRHQNTPTAASFFFADSHFEKDDRLI